MSHRARRIVVSSFSTTVFSLFLVGGAQSVLASDTTGGYVVVSVAFDRAGDEQAAYQEIAKRVADFHHATPLNFDGGDFADLEKRLHALRPRNVLFVIPPAVLDANFHRRVFRLCSAMDDDIFADFAVGYLTAKNGDQLRQLWERIEKLHREGLAGRTWIEASVASGMTSTTYADSGISITTAAGFTGPHIYWCEATSDPNVMAFVAKALPELEKADVLVFGGNGDPQGIWVFDDQRNMDETKHWDYSAEKVGHDPKGEMPRITADRFAKLKLKSPIVWSGTCHSATPCDVYVEGDIVSTFGRSEKVVRHRLKPDESLCLALLEGGAAALLAPIGPNHGYSTINEAQFALLHGATLGETILSTYNDVLLASNGRPGLATYLPGKEHHEPAGSIMWSGGSNRILIGDPALAPFKATADPLESVEVTAKRADAFDVRVEWKEGFHPYTWDLYGRDHKRDGRVYARIGLDDLGESGKGAKFTATVDGTDAGKTDLPLTVTHIALEEYHGKRYLHLQANAPRESSDRKEIRVTFHVQRAE